MSEWATTHFNYDAEVDEAGDIWFNAHWANDEQLKSFAKTL